MPRLLAIFATLACLALVSVTNAEAQGATDLLKKGKDATKLGQPLDLNTASVGDLKKLPGVGDTGAQKIVAGRPFAKTSDLVDKNILSAAAFDKVKNLITVK